MNCEGDLDDFDPCETCDEDPETCDCDPSECACIRAEEHYEGQREAME